MTLEHGEGLRDRQMRERRARILDAAARLIRATGGTGLSMRTLADQAEVSLATPYNLFGSKGGVLMALQFSALEKLEQAMEEQSARDPIEQVLEVADLGARIYTGDPSFWLPLMQAHWLARGAIHESPLHPRIVALWNRSLQAGVRAGRLIPEANPEFVARLLVVCFYGVLVLWIQGNLDGNGFRTHVLYGFVLTLLGVATPVARPKLIKHLQGLEREMAAGAGRLQTAPTRRSRRRASVNSAG
ncbi:MAG TPA: TetR/AcrR family transcriptional regulator [Candidatus Binataceae bacterium]|jgi:AcrR family transcriptional regulator|nr:TetR/AcrR family transcriptional regulator [Candidatus Binataceae bacterium]